MGIMSPRRKTQESFSEEEEEAGGGENKKSCADCKTTKTPLWRGGPSGPKSLCNACGIRYRKRRSSTAPLKLSQGGAERKMRERQQQQHPVHNSQSQVNRKTSINDTEPGSGGGSVSSGSCSGCGRDVMSEPLNMRRLMIFGKELLVQTKYVKRQRCQRKRIKFGDEEEQAAFSLIALSCGAVFA